MPLCSHLLEAGCISRFLSLRFFCSPCTFCYSVPCYSNHLCRCAILHKSGLEFSFSTVAAYIGGGLLLVVSILLYLCFLIAMQRQCKYLERASIFQNKCLFFNVSYNYNVYLGTFVNIQKHFITIIYNYICLQCNMNTIYVYLYTCTLYIACNIGLIFALPCSCALYRRFFVHVAIISIKQL